MGDKQIGLRCATCATVLHQIGAFGSAVGRRKTMDARLQRRVQRYGWDLAADHYEPLWHAQLAEAQAAMMALASPAPGNQVLDIACHLRRRVVRARAHVHAQPGTGPAGDAPGITTRRSRLSCGVGRTIEVRMVIGVPNRRCRGSERGVPSILSSRAERHTRASMCRCRVRGCRTPAHLDNARLRRCKRGL
jgi:hypothetical protein